jgi:CRISPR-associated protein Csm1
VQVFLQGKLLGIDPFVRQAGDGFADLAGRCLYASILAESIPRALLDHLHLSRQLLGSSGAGQFLVVLTSESLAAAHEFLTGVTTSLQTATGGTLRLAWAATENLGGWTDVRKRLQEGMERWRGLNALDPATVFAPVAEEPPGADYAALFEGLPDSLKLRWSGEGPLLLEPGDEALPLAHHAAPSETGPGAATPAELAARAAGRPVWGVLRGDVDQFESRLRRASTIEEHLQVSMFYRQFFSGEVQVLCSQGEFWQKVTVLYTGGDDFAVAGAWDALPGFAREMERLFKMSAEEFLKDYAGPEGKTLSMAIALAPHDGAPAAAVLAEAGQRLEVAKSAGRDMIDVFGRTLDWKSFTEAAEIRADDAPGGRIWLLPAVSRGVGSVLPRDRPGAGTRRRGPAGAALAVPPAADAGAGILRQAARVSEGARRPAGGVHGTAAGPREIAARGPGGARMGAPGAGGLARGARRRVKGLPKMSELENEIQQPANRKLRGPP